LLTKESKDEADNLRTSESQKGYSEGYDKGYNESIQKYNSGKNQIAVDNLCVDL
jgi:hypothetical protein